MKTTHQLVIEVVTEGEVDLDQLELRCLHALRRVDQTDGELIFNTVVHETSYPTPNPEEL